MAVVRNCLVTRLSNSRVKLTPFMEQALHAMSGVEPAVAYSKAAGLTAAVIVFFASGCNASFAKMAGPGTSVVVYISYVSDFTFIWTSVAMIIMGVSVAFVWQGVLAGVLLTLCLYLATLAVWRIGLAWAEMTVASVATLVSFSWGYFVFHAPVHDKMGTLAGVLVLISGAIALALTVAPRYQMASDACVKSAVLGLLLSITAGASLGSSLPLIQNVPPDLKRGSFTWSYSLGMLLLSNLILGICFMVDGRVTKEEFPTYFSNPKDVYVVRNRWAMYRLLPLAGMQGFLVAGSNIATGIAAASELGVSPSQPAREAGHCIAVILGAVVFQEFGKLDIEFVTKLTLATLINICGLVLLCEHGAGL